MFHAAFDQEGVAALEDAPSFKTATLQVRALPLVGIRSVGTAGTAGTAGRPFLISERTRRQRGQLGQRFAPSEDSERKSGGVFRVVWGVSQTRWYGVRFSIF
jgi:hypothetical protein